MNKFLELGLGIGEVLADHASRAGAWFTVILLGQAKSGRVVVTQAEDPLLLGKTGHLALPEGTPNRSEIRFRGVYHKDNVKRELDLSKVPKHWKTIREEEPGRLLFKGSIAEVVPAKETNSVRTTPEELKAIVAAAPEGTTAIGGEITYVVRTWEKPEEEEAETSGDEGREWFKVGVDVRGVALDAMLPRDGVEPRAGDTLVWLPEKGRLGFLEKPASVVRPNPGYDPDAVPEDPIVARRLARLAKAKPSYHWRKPTKAVYLTALAPRSGTFYIIPAVWRG